MVGDSHLWERLFGFKYEWLSLVHIDKKMVEMLSILEKWPIPYPIALSFFLWIRGLKDILNLESLIHWHFQWSLDSPIVCCFEIDKLLINLIAKNESLCAYKIWDPKWSVRRHIIDSLVVIVVLVTCNKGIQNPIIFLTKPLHIGIWKP